MADIIAAVEPASDPSSSRQSGASTPLRLNVALLAHGHDSSFFFEPLPYAANADVDAITDTLEKRGDEEQSDSDIYRGSRPPSPPPRPVDIDQASVASSSSSSSLNVGRRIGALASAVEGALARWARAHSSASSTTSSSSSSTSISSTSRTHTTRRLKGRRYSSSASVHNAAHERALIARKKAHEEFRVVPREFTLLLPPESAPSPAHSSAAAEQAKDSRVISTTSLPVIMNQLESALKKSAKSRKALERLTSSDTSTMRTTNKGKGKSTAGKSSGIPKATGSNGERSTAKTASKSWWLDVASPTWDDLRSIGKLLRLHPLTLEDILHRDPREKLELFPGLGYYFIVFRAIESERSRERFRRFKMQGTDGTVALPSSSADEGVVGAVNVYMVVFAEGICSFHYEDVSEHTDRLRSRILQMDRTFDMTSDWIAHGLIDSIVDSFFPLLMSIEKELKDVDSLISENPSSQPTATVVPDTASPDDRPAESSGSSDSTVEEKPSPEQSRTSDDEKGAYEKEARSLLPLTLRLSWPHFALMRHVKCTLQKVFRSRSKERRVEEAEAMTAAFRTLVRIATIRRIVTSLGRLLGTKGEVVAQIRKRLILATLEGNSANLGFDIPSDGEVAIYMGDIQDHIITLQQALGHYERVLSHSHPAYLSRLSVSQSEARAGTDKALLLLTIVSVTVLAIQVILGLFSMNLEVILNRITGTPEHPFAVFFPIMSAAILIGIGVVSLARFWYVRAKKRYSRATKI